MKKVLLALMAMTAIVCCVSKAEANLFVAYEVFVNGDIYNPGLPPTFESDEFIGFSFDVLNFSTNGETFGSDTGDYILKDTLIDGVPNYFITGSLSSFFLSPGESARLLGITFGPMNPPSGFYSGEAEFSFKENSTNGEVASVTTIPLNWYVSDAAAGQPSNAVPEPATMLLFGSGLLGAFFKRKFV